LQLLELFQLHKHFEWLWCKIVEYNHIEWSLNQIVDRWKDWLQWPPVAVGVTPLTSQKRMLMNWQWGIHIHLLSVFLQG
jgi:hypothetical protein